MSRHISDDTKVVHVEALYWVTTTVHFHGFGDLPESESKRSPPYSSLGYYWQLLLGREYSKGNTSNYCRDATLILYGRSQQTYVKIYYQFLNAINNRVAAHVFSGKSGDCHPTWSFKLSDASNHVRNGTLSIQIRMATDDYRIPPHTNTSFIPSNPSVCKTIQDSFMAEDSADVVIEVAENEGVEASPTKFYAHYFILKRASPLLAELCKSDNFNSPYQIQILGESLEAINDMLLYIYGLEIPKFGKDLSRTKKVLETANKYGVKNLKIAAEACYAASLSITIHNVVEQLLFADSLNCALLKEKALEFIVNNAIAIAEKKLLPVDTASLQNEILLAMALNGKTGGGFDTMNVNELRRLSYERGLDIDGTREMLIAELKKK